MDLKVAPLKAGQALDGHHHPAAHSIPREKNYNIRDSSQFYSQAELECRAGIVCVMWV